MIFSLLFFFIFSSLTVIFSPLFSLGDLILNLALQNHLVDFFNLVFNFFKDMFIVFPIILSCGISLISVSFIIHYSGKKIIDAMIKNGGNIGTRVIGLVTGLNAALNLSDRFKGDKGDKGEGSSSGSGDSDSDKDTDKKDNDKKEGNKDSTENKTDDKKNKN